VGRVGATIDHTSRATNANLSPFPSRWEKRRDASDDAVYVRGWDSPHSARACLALLWCSITQNGLSGSVEPNSNGAWLTDKSSAPPQFQMSDAAEYAPISRGQTREIKGVAGENDGVALASLR